MLLGVVPIGQWPGRKEPGSVPKIALVVSAVVSAYEVKGCEPIIYARILASRITPELGLARVFQGSTANTLSRWFVLKDTRYRDDDVYFNDF